ncbi:PP2C family protein-serine/threonine phosphatase [Streptomyces sp. H10-C2]|uniref:PP2C family protein-serine/threonine phosphatase n=1 Tax=unclassified Streptomyces TaxID=2593676 RepID=UPI0024BBAF02|nr:MULTISPECIES: PP2C family protein-serine/threonine phosphatase [unclassified Streptomyces]MDJ0347266.1 PP2C family protein-serine/threonine phosphatase [Streptomyces sp. PH10-H1]MDJ0375492.1 PP2C family protein-serine/threonine phosphatase [Streptomyces sp. H10-C2]
MSRRRLPRSPSADDLLTALQQLTVRARHEVKLHQARMELAEALQRGMLPAALPSLPGLRTAARYSPARSGLDIGGDWYDGFVFPDGALGFAIGDVQGHDVEAAAVMGQIRIGMRAIASTCVHPGEVLGRTNDLLLSVETGLFATSTLVRFDPRAWEVASARAGHVAAVWATVDGGSGITEGAGGLPLGIASGQHYPVTRRKLTTAGVLVLLTDGVIEGPSFPIDDGLENVLRIVGSRADADADELADAVLRAADLTGHEDDAAVVVLRHDGPPDRTGETPPDRTGETPLDRTRETPPDLTVSAMPEPRTPRSPAQGGA